MITNAPLIAQFELFRSAPPNTPIRVTFNSESGWFISCPLLEVNMNNPAHSDGPTITVRRMETEMKAGKSVVVEVDHVVPARDISGTITHNYVPVRAFPDPANAVLTFAGAPAPMGTLGEIHEECLEPA
jgi:hypothetical protein